MLASRVCHARAAAIIAAAKRAARDCLWQSAAKAKAGGLLEPPASLPSCQERPVSDDDPANSSKQRLLMLLAFSAVYVMWGSTYLAIRVGVRSLPLLPSGCAS